MFIPRTMVLDGAAMLVFWGGRPTWPFLRARALENRVFVAAVNDRFAAIIGPDGAVLSCTSGESRSPPIASINLLQAADKLVAPRHRSSGRATARRPIASDPGRAAAFAVDLDVDKNLFLGERSSLVSSI